MLDGWTRSQRANRSELQQADHELASLGRSGGRLRLQLGEALHALAVNSGHHTLGFSSLAAYALERCERGARFAGESRALAKKLLEKHDTGLPKLRAAILRGEVLWSMGELLARHATPDNEDELLAQAKELRTVRAMKDWLCDDTEPEPEPTIKHIESGTDEVLMVEASRVLLELLDGRRPSDEHLLDALLAEGETSLHNLGVRSGSFSEDELQRWREFAKQTAEAEAEAAEPAIPDVLPLDTYREPEPLPEHPVDLDPVIRKLCHQLATRDLELGRLAAPILRRKAWRKLGYASAKQYATERIGLSLSSLQAKVRLARACDELPELGQALQSGTLGFEACRQLARVANLDTIEAWLQRAEHRTLKHLREDVDVVLRRAKFSMESSLLPPTDEEREDVAKFERSVQSGELQSDLLSNKKPGTQISVAVGSGTDIRLRVSPDLADRYDHLKRRFQTVAPPTASFIAFLALSLFDAWLPSLRQFRDKWGHIYQRDGFQCSSPVCNRRDVTPHHLRFQSQGGGHEDENLTSLCSFCHLEGVHAGRIQAKPPASNIEWTLGRSRILKVTGPHGH